MSCDYSLKGCNGATEYGVGAYGNMNNQVRMNEFDNSIQVNRQTGGRRRRKGKKSCKKGGNITNLAVPISLLTLNHMYKNKTNKTGYKGRKSRRNRRR